jgi:hypothetical protein
MEDQHAQGLFEAVGSNGKSKLIGWIISPFDAGKHQVFSVVFQVTNRHSPMLTTVPTIYATLLSRFHCRLSTTNKIRNDNFIGWW